MYISPLKFVTAVKNGVFSFTKYVLFLIQKNVHITLVLYLCKQ
jgi:hypothetical protein